jgi:hypothetical protein
LVGNIDDGLDVVAPIKGRQVSGRNGDVSGRGGGGLRRRAEGGANEASPIGEDPPAAIHGSSSFSEEREDEEDEDEDEDEEEDERRNEKNFSRDKKTHEEKSILKV